MAQQPDPLLQQNMERLRTRCEQLYKHISGTTQPCRWMLPTLNGWSGNPFELSNISKPFDRATLNTEAINNASVAGNAGVGAGKGIQINYVGAMERSFRRRHQSVVRAQAHLAGRSKAHGDVLGIHTNDTLSYIQNILNSGGG